MLRRSARRLGVVALVTLILVLNGCGNSKKGNGYGFVPRPHPALSSTATVFAD